MYPAACLLCLAALCGMSAAAAAPVVQAAAVDSGAGCARLLANGVFNTFSESTSDKTQTVSQSSFQSSMCSSSSSIVEVGTSSGGGGSFGISIGGFGFSLGRSRQEAQRKLEAYKSNFCTSQSGGSFGSTLSQSAINIMSSWVDPNLLTAYIECMKIDQQGMSLSYSLTKNAQAITITMGYFLQTGGGVTFQGYSVTGPAKCKYLSTLLKPGYKLNSVNGRHSLQCTRTRAGGVTVTVSTSAGAQDFDMPDLLVPLAESRVIAKLAEAVATLRKEAQELRAALVAYTDSKGAAVAAAVQPAADNAVSALARVAAVEQRLPPVELITTRMSYDGGRDILNINTARTRVNSLSTTAITKSGFCEEGGQLASFWYSCSWGWALSPGTCQANGAWSGDCYYNGGGGGGGGGDGGGARK